MFVAIISESFLLLPKHITRIYFVIASNRYLVISRLYLANIYKTSIPIYLYVTYTQYNCSNITKTRKMKIDRCHHKAIAFVIFQIPFSEPLLQQNRYKLMSACWVFWFVSARLSAFQDPINCVHVISLNFWNWRALTTGRDERITQMAHYNAIHWSCLMFRLLQNNNYENKKLLLSAFNLIKQNCKLT